MYVKIWNGNINERDSKHWMELHENLNEKLMENQLFTVAFLFIYDENNKNERKSKNKNWKLKLQVQKQHISFDKCVKYGNFTWNRKLLQINVFFVRKIVTNALFSKNTSIIPNNVSFYFQTYDLFYVILVFFDCWTNCSCVQMNCSDVQKSLKKASF